MLSIGKTSNNGHGRETPPLPPIEQFKIDTILGELEPEVHNVVDSLMTVITNYRQDLSTEISKTLTFENQIQHKNVKLSKLIDKSSKNLVNKNKKLSTKIFNTLDKEIDTLLELSDASTRLFGEIFENLKSIESALPQQDRLSHVDSPHRLHYPKLYKLLNRDELRRRDQQNGAILYSAISNTLSPSISGSADVSTISINGDWKTLSDVGTIDSEFTKSISTGNQADDERMDATERPEDDSISDESQLLNESESEDNSVNNEYELDMERTVDLADLISQQKTDDESEFRLADTISKYRHSQHKMEEQKLNDILNKPVEMSPSSSPATILTKNPFLLLSSAKSDAIAESSFDMIHFKKVDLSHATRAVSKLILSNNKSTNDLADAQDGIDEDEELARADDTSDIDTSNESIASTDSHANIRAVFSSSSNVADSITNSLKKYLG